MISRRRLLGAVALGSIAAPIWAQPAKSRPRRIGFLGNGSASAFANHIAGLRTGLREAGYEEPRNLSIDFRWAEGKASRLPDFVRELVRLPVEVLVTQGVPATRAAKEATKTIPIVMAAVGDAVDTGLVSNLARPGGNLTGVTFFAIEIGVKRLELLKQALPQTQRVAVMHNPENPIQRLLVEAIRSAASSLKLDLEVLALPPAGQFADAFSQLAKKRADAILFIEEPVQLINAGVLTSLAARHSLASIGPLEFLQAGCPMVLGVNFPELYRRAAGFIARILDGAMPGDLPVERATRFEFVVNLTAAKALGLPISPAVLQRADRVIE
jgi:putative ABC transport system substrate-binding protein